jgi:hypothetical protein
MDNDMVARVYRATCDKCLRSWDYADEVAAETRAQNHRDSVTHSRDTHLEFIYVEVVS